jgi:hypothetical protein
MGFFVLNLSLSMWIAFIWISKDIFLRFAASLLIATFFVLLCFLPWNSFIESIYSYPDSFRIVHKTLVLGQRVIWFWPAMPNSIFEPVLIAASLLGGASLLSLSAKRLTFSYFAILVLALLPFIVFAEWALPVVNNVVFKLIPPDVAYRIAWTSLFWISIPVVAQELSKSIFFGYSCKHGVKAFVQGLIVVLALPVNVGASSNIFHSKIPHLLEPIRLKSMVDGSDMQPLLYSIAKFCAKQRHDLGSKILSDPMVGSVVNRSSCYHPLALRDYNSLTLDAAEQLIYPGLKQSLGHPARLRRWLASRNVGLIILRSHYPNYTSDVGLNSGHWQADLVSSYRNLALNGLDGKKLSEAGYLLLDKAGGYEIYVPASLATY